MLQQFLSTILAFVTSVFGANTPIPPTQDSSYQLPAEISEHTTYMNAGTCFDDFNFATFSPDNSYNPELSISTLPPAPTTYDDLLVQRCGGADGQATLTAHSIGDYEPYTYTLSFKDLVRNRPTQTITFDQSFQAYGPGCRIEDVTASGYSETGDNLDLTWSKILITCAVGDGGFAATEHYSIDLTTSQVDLISRCDLRPIAILDSFGEVAHLDSTPDCTYPFGTGENGGIPYGNDGLE